MNTQTFKTINGNIPILISAPHVFAHKRPRLSMVYKHGEPFTDEIVEQICEKTGSFGIVLVNEADYDPNYHKEKSNPYKQEVSKIIKENKIEIFIDIHGLKDGNGYDMSIHYPTRYSKSLRLAEEVRRGLDRGGLRGVNIAILRFLDNHQETLGEYVASKLRVPSVQIEIARYVREDSRMREEFIKNISEVLEKKVI